MPQTLDTEVCIVGSGAAGAVIADTLTAAGKQVVVVEQGPKYGLERKAEVVEMRQQRLVNEAVVDFNEGWPKAFNMGEWRSVSEKYVSGWQVGAGGSTLHWHGHVPRPLEDDLRARTKYGVGRDYPVTYKELEPWLLRAEIELGVSCDPDNPYAAPRSGPFPMPGHKPSQFEVDHYLPATKKLGWIGHAAPWAINSREYDGRVPCQRCRYCMVCPSGARYSADRSHLARFVARPNATLLTETKAVRLESSKDGKRIEAIHATKRDGDTVVLRAKQFILAMGAIETPRMLLRSDDHAKDKGGIGNGGGQLGVGFTDHLMFSFTMQLKSSASHLYGYPTRYTDYHRANVDRREHGSFFYNLWPNGSGEGADIFSVYRKLSDTPTSVSMSKLRAGLSRSVLGFGFLERDGVGRLTLDADRPDDLGTPQAAIDLSMSEREKRTMKAAIKAAEELAGAMDVEGFADTYTTTGQPWHGEHPSGGAAMGKTQDAGVCDPNCRVFGKDNLFLASGATLPHQGAQNPTLVIVAFAIRLADHLKRVN